MTRADIVQAALRAWGRDYYRTTSLSDVARELGVSKAALYRHFSSKQALLEAMYEWVLDDYAAKVREGFQRAAAAGPREAMVIMVRVIMGYYARNAYAFIFSLVYVYGERRMGDSREFLARRGVDLGIFDGLRGAVTFPQAIPMVLATLTFAMAYFHRLGPSERTAATGVVPLGAGNFTEAEVERDISLALYVMFHGLGLSRPTGGGGL
jgi:AcrR family transcriptional regulator